MKLRTCCGNCCFWNQDLVLESGDEPVDMGECVRNPPILIPDKSLSELDYSLKSFDALGHRTRFPVTTSSMVCGEWGPNKG